MQNFINIAEDKVKNVIIEILSVEWPLTAKRIFNRIKRKYHKKVSYQAVFKALNEMLKKNIVKKIKYVYSLNPVWINEAANFYQGIKRSYESKPTNYITRILKEQSFTLEFENQYDSMLKTLEVANKLIFIAKKDNYQTFSEIRHMPWIFCCGEEEHKKLKDTIKKFNRIYALCRGNSEGDKTIVEFIKPYKNIHVLLGQDCSKDHDTIVAGDIVAQIFYPKGFQDEIDKIYRTFKSKFKENINKMNDLLFDKKIKIIAVITRNKEFAKLKKKQFVEAFKKIGTNIEVNME